MTESAAPGELERVREFINTWWIPNDTRVPEDRLTASPEVVAFRDDLRAALGQERPGAVQAWLRRHPLRAEVSQDPGEPALVLRPEGESPIGPLLAVVAAEIGTGRWARLKACPDCQWVFYDHSRNASRRWCAMAPAGSGGRGCGSIAKVRAYRRRRAPAETSDES
ncbi:CGNR zinc finger domain-containing protein [Nonomuraea jiangxiensis]|uniref:CGNR zinc finger domain-containing protein n=1 Tax=Nonomuraea jiangxiensis TaxID=633440 RepID=A0A1G9BB89_9ACTN|nr:CGNR zinc finger domain-containing protein [Nonomuraea jiangxiensis]SDK36733.1 CGNR zinc finger domain-containing protein [Nonomuraea jiangxiensis]